MHGEDGQSLVETIVALGLVVLIGGAVASGALVGTPRFGPDPRATALQRAADRELRAATDVAKYADARLQPSAIATTVPMPNASPIPVTMVLTTTALAGGGLTVEIDARTLDGTVDADAATTLASRAPLPGSQVIAPQTVAQPTGAP